MNTEKWMEEVLARPDEYDPNVIDILHWIKECRQSEESYAHAFAIAVKWCFDYIDESTREERILALASHIRMLVNATKEDYFYPEDYLSLLDTLWGRMIK